MGNGRGAAVLRILIWFINTLLLMIYISPKAYWPLGWHPSGQYRTFDFVWSV